VAGVCYQFIISLHFDLISKNVACQKEAILHFQKAIPFTAGHLNVHIIVEDID
jgi:hypothetical protein